MHVVFWVLIFAPLAHSVVPSIHRFQVEENTPSGFVIGQLPVKQRSAFTSLARKPISEYIFIHPTNGSVITTQRVDREDICKTDGTVNISFSSQHSNSPSCDVTFLVHITINEESLLETICVTIFDVNDNPPVFEPPTITISVPESSPTGTMFYMPPAQDADLGKNSINGYHLTRIHADINPQTCSSHTVGDDDIFSLVISADNAPQLRQIKELDYEMFRRLFYCLYAYDGEGLTVALLVTVEIQDVNDNSPQWIGLPYQVRLPECAQEYRQPMWKTNDELGNFLRVKGYAYDAPVRFLIQVVAIDADSKDNGMIQFSIAQTRSATENNHKAIVYLDKVYLIGHLDYEATPKFFIPIEAKDGGGLTNVTNIEVNLEDCNDNKPEISVTTLSPLPARNSPDWRYSKQADIWIPEEDEKEIKLATVTVTDADTGENAAVSCDVEWNNIIGANPFHLVSLKPPITAIKVPVVFTLIKRSGVKLDREAAPNVQVTIICADRGRPQINVARQTFNIGILDINDNAPKFQNVRNIDVKENEPNGALVGYVLAHDSDLGRNSDLKYSIISCEQQNVTLLFMIDDRTGKITTLRSLDRETKSTYCVTVTATDAGDPPLSSSVNITISVLDVNDSPPVFEGNRNESGRIIFEILESFGQNRLIKQFIGQINATDADNGPSGTLEYSFKQTSGFFWQNHSAANFWISRGGQLHVDGILDRESLSEHKFTVVVTDSGPLHQRLTSEIGVTIRLQDQNDNGPVFTRPTSLTKGHSPSVAAVNISNNAAVNSSVFRICAKDEDSEEYAKINFTLRCAQYLKPFFGIGRIDVFGGTEACTDVIVKRSLTEILQSNAPKQMLTPIEHQLYVTVMDLGARQFTKTARVRLFVRHELFLKATRAPEKDSRKVQKSGTVMRQAWTHHIEDPRKGLPVVHQAPGANFSGSLTSESFSFPGLTKAKYLFIVAAVVFTMFVIALGLLAFLFLRDCLSKGQTIQLATSVEGVLNSQRYCGGETAPITYTADYLEGKICL
ncbi:unnamed protein product [Mesocestoides corti]|uniref:Cadherin domain-containing protein n=1 Tax=Mesocestoides corti TaxID=53468 RepID=A0A0R3UH74_MESCO|nr:unnamed protein product [Mesocestoides corti]